MSDTTRQFAEGMLQFGTIVGCLALGGAIGLGLASWLAPGSSFAMISSALLFPASILLAWMLMFPLAVLALPLMIPRFIRWLRNPLPERNAAPAPARANRPHPAGWLFLATALPMSLVAGLIAGAPLIYMLAGILYGLVLRRATVLLEVRVE